MEPKVVENLQNSKDEPLSTIRGVALVGALSYSINGIEYRNLKGREPMVTVSKDGPYLITGGID
jgi:hypothetical protein